MTTGPPRTPGTATRQSLAHGPLGAALLHIERAHHGTGPWQAVHDQLADIGPLIDGEHASLFLGAPAMTYVLHLAAADSNRYARALHTLDRIVTGLTRQRLTAAHARIEQGRYATFAEYDLFRGLTGLGALLLRRQPGGSDELKGVLAYIVRLTEPATGPEGHTRPGWWVGHTPTNRKRATPGGHANAGLAHGISGPLALLALSRIRGITVDGHDTAINRICRWLDEIRHSDQHRTRWPRWVTEAGPEHARPTVPSWCYGTPGLARAQQLAAIALGDAERKRMAERALLQCLADAHRLAGRGLCHGFGGLLRTVQRVAQDADDTAKFTDHLPQLSTRFLAEPPPGENGFLEGTTGATLAFQSAEQGCDLTHDWDACLLLN